MIEDHFGDGPDVFKIFIMVRYSLSGKTLSEKIFVGENFHHVANILQLFSEESFLLRYYGYI